LSVEPVRRPVRVTEHYEVAPSDQPGVAIYEAPEDRREVLRGLLWSAPATARVMWWSELSRWSGLASLLGQGGAGRGRG
jgi:hypothetical protein